MKKITNLDLVRLDARKERLMQKGARWPTAVTTVITDAEYELMLLLETAAYQQDLLVWTNASLRQVVGLNVSEDRSLSEAAFFSYASAVATYVLLSKDLNRVYLVVLMDSVPGSLKKELQSLGVPLATLASSHSDANRDGKSALVKKWILQATTQGMPIWSINQRRKPNLHHRLCSLHLRSALRILPLRDYRFTGGVDESEFTPELSKEITELAHEIRSTHWTLLEEVPLSRLIHFTGAVDKKISEFVRRSSVDALIISAAPRAIPLLAIEFDGGVHEQENQIKKDTWKDDLLADAQIPLLRISTREVAVAEWDRATSEIRHRMNSYFDPAIQIALWVASACRDEWLRHLDSSNIAKNAASAEGALSTALYGKVSKNLNAAQRESLRETDLMRKFDSELEMVNSFAAFKQEKWDQDYSLGNQLHRTGIAATRVRDFKIVKLTNSKSWHAHAFLATNTGELEIKTLPISFNFPRGRMFKVDDYIEAYLKMAWAQLASDFSKPLSSS